MLRLFPALALVLSLGLAGPGTVSAAPLITVETAPGDDAAIIDGVKRTHAPDPRTKLFEVTAETSGGITVLKGRTDSAEALSDLRAAYYVQKRPVDVRVKLLPDSDDLKKKVWAFTTAPVTRITDLSGRPVTTVPAGTPAARLDEKDGMTLLRLPDGSIGLARSTDVRPSTETEILIRNRHERLIVTADEAVFKPLQEESAPSADVVLPRGAILRLDGAGDGVMRTALPDGRRGTIAVSAVEKLADFERREESERRSDPAAFMKALSETAVREAASGRHANGLTSLRVRDFIRNHAHLIRLFIHSVACTEGEVKGMISANVLLREGRHVFRGAVDAVSRSRNGGRWLCRSQFVHCSGMQMERGYHRLRTAFQFVGGGIVCCVLSLTSRRVYEFTRSQRRVGLFLFAVSRTQPRAVRRDGEVLFGKFSPRGSRLFNAGRRRSPFGVLCRDCLRALQGDLP